jgi:hypothetical protein
MRLVKEAVEHPDHPGLVGDLMQLEGQPGYILLVYDPERDRYDRYSLPHKWAVMQAEAV